MFYKIKKQCSLLRSCLADAEKMVEQVFPPTWRFGGYVRKAHNAKRGENVNFISQNSSAQFYTDRMSLGLIFMGGNCWTLFFFVYKWFYLVLENHCKWREPFVGNGEREIPFGNQNMEN